MNQPITAGDQTRARRRLGSKRTTASSRPGSASSSSSRDRCDRRAGSSTPSVSRRAKSSTVQRVDADRRGLGPGARRASPRRRRRGLGAQGLWATTGAARSNAQSAVVGRSFEPDGSAQGAVDPALGQRHPRRLSPTCRASGDVGRSGLRARHGEERARNRRRTHDPAAGLRWRPLSQVTVNERRRQLVVAEHRGRRRRRHRRRLPADRRPRQLLERSRALRSGRRSASSIRPSTRRPKSS